jgi:hypothetical protein
VRSPGQAFCKVVDKLGPAPAPAADPPAALPPPLAGAEELAGVPHGIPTLAQLGYPPFPADDAVLFRGGETAGLARLHAQMVRVVRGRATDAWLPQRVRLRA